MIYSVFPAFTSAKLMKVSLQFIMYITVIVLQVRYYDWYWFASVGLAGVGLTQQVNCKAHIQFVLSMYNGVH